MKILFTLLSISTIFFVSCNSPDIKNKPINNIGSLQNSQNNIKQKDSILLQETYKGGNVKYIVYAKDSTIDKDVECKELHISYYKNGKLKERGCQGLFGPWGVPVGTWTKYDSLGYIAEKTKYYHDETKGKAETIRFYKNGRKKEEITIGYDPHYGELDSIWSWTVYTEEGKMINKLENEK